ncbi:MAG: c-type cytochrome [Verrucomicrobiota bacterium]
MQHSQFISPISCLLLMAFNLQVSHASDPEPVLKILQPGVRMTLMAEHPDLETPIGLDVDGQGRLWVVESHTHFRPESYQGSPHDEIVVFSDRDGDGRTEHRSVFYNATAATMDLELGPDGWVYLAERDRILRIKDSDGDGKADVEENLATLETEGDYPHNALAGLGWDVDGNLMFGLGENHAKAWTLTGTDGTSFRGFGEGGVFRCDAQGGKLRRVARGFWNPFALCVRGDGEIFLVDNDPSERPPCRLLHIVEGGEYGFQRAYGKEAHHPFVCWNGELRGTLPMLYPSGEAPCGVQALGQGLVGLTWGDHRVDFYPLERKGMGFQTRRVVLVEGGRYFRPVCLTRGKAVDGRMVFYMTDWVKDDYVLHGKGRLWKMEIDLAEAAPWLGKGASQEPDEMTLRAAKLRDGSHGLTRAGMLKLASDKDPYLAQAALMGLARESSDWTPAEVNSWRPADRLSALLALKMSVRNLGREVDEEAWLRPFMADENFGIQFEALRWIADERLEQFLPQVKDLLSKPGLDFRLFEAIAATWNSLSGEPGKGVRNTAMLLEQVHNPAASPEIRAYALRLLPARPRNASTKGVSLSIPFPKGLTLKLLEQLLVIGDEELSREVVQTLAGNPKVGRKRLAAIAKDPDQTPTLRADAIAGLASVSAEYLSLLLQLATVDERLVREEALRSLRYAKLSGDQTESLRKVSKAHPDSAVLVKAILEPTSLAAGRPAITDTTAWLKRLDALPGPADLKAGQRIFNHSTIGTCSRCHRHNGRGAVVGPDLGAVEKKGDRQWILQSILNPNFEIAPEYLPTMVSLKDGTSLIGFPLRINRSGPEVMRDVNGQNRSFNRDDVVSQQDLRMSLMPVGLPLAMTDRELRDLLAYLESAGQNATK